MMKMMTHCTKNAWAWKNVDDQNIMQRRIPRLTWPQPTQRKPKVTQLSWWCTDDDDDGRKIIKVTIKIKIHLCAACFLQPRTSMQEKGLKSANCPVPTRNTRRDTNSLAASVASTSKIQKPLLFWTYTILRLWSFIRSAKFSFMPQNREKYSIVSISISDIRDIRFGQSCLCAVARYFLFGTPSIPPHYEFTKADWTTFSIRTRIHQLTFLFPGSMGSRVFF